ncbi:hypothetical protein E4U43_005306 [Claviceps pusilla]|uniref:Cyanovirin-N domain-containing protein n=1 Tax=Claviceps pusilla TaxID=123648 RepID=A0A9P7N3L7_9HYPO|nr:hypothetical protein E4U43_005306 [Claviceps pusilla]
MHFSTITALATIAISAGQTLAQLPPSCNQVFNIGNLTPPQVCDNRKDPSVYVCADGTTVQRDVDVFNVNTGSSGNFVSLVCKADKRNIMSQCAPNVSGALIMSGCKDVIVQVQHSR